MVWVNTDSGVYHKPGTRWYGKTKQGKYMTEADAQKAGATLETGGNSRDLFFEPTVLSGVTPENFKEQLEALIGKLQGALLGSERRIAVIGSTAARLMKVFAMQMEVRRRLRIGGHQFVRVEHVHVNDGGQAVIGNVKRSDRHD